MRGILCVVAATTASLALVLPGMAQQTGTPGQFYSGFTPTSIVHKPVDMSKSVAPLNFQNTMMPRSQSNKVVNINNLFHNIQMPLFRSQAPSAPIVPPGVNNPLQPINQSIQVPKK